ncbi:uncharacterized protein LY89DRAFT_664073 [Mollisia scopiformis]|uniref:Uncharacterized protein n=1 Tax=Mollisia scopiformis TaxID=149040 RepID=A0A194XPZ4_MOLSC|nr:uncharacterized protein LY89DRAFT_664073 [Mollisia scopiformis]KUJ22231.1 hypothetical protein LY89DRAFT_664073 [Mollisia scopiformis]
MSTSSSSQSSDISDGMDPDQPIESIEAHEAGEDDEPKDDVEAVGDDEAEEDYQAEEYDPMPNLLDHEVMTLCSFYVSYLHRIGLIPIPAIEEKPKGRQEAPPSELTFDDFTESFNAMNFLELSLLGATDTYDHITLLNKEYLIRVCQSVGGPLLQ